ncbi:MAG: pyridoxamine 5'-phosphate oxidase family protein [Dehalococcoidales bacterium]|nr:pyridoxamine 5'-phosphate oxidase family protein [Dehalococcoidales bacterium]
MDKKEILEFINKNPIAYLATAEGNTPHVRAMGTYRADEKGIIFAMQSPKDVYKQLIKNPAAELCYYADGLQIRVAGQMEEIKDQAIKEEVVEKRTFYKPGVEEHGLDYVGVFKMKNARATILDMKGPPSPVGAPKVWVDL